MLSIRSEGKYNVTIISVPILLIIASLLLSAQITYNSYSESQPNDRPQATTLIEEEMVFDMSEMPLFFTENIGQVESPEVFFYGHLGLTCVVLESNRIYLQDPKVGTILELVFINARTCTPLGVDQQYMLSNFFLGNRGTFQNVKCYSEIVYRDIWLGIDLHLRITAAGLKYDYIVYPGGNVSDIQIGVTGHENLYITREQIIVGMDSYSIIDNQLKAFQEEQPIHVEFTQRDVNVYGFRMDDYDYSSVLEIEPLLYSTLIGGSSIDISRDIVVDDEKNVYITGRTGSMNFPTLNSYDSTYNSGTASVTDDCFITKLNPLGDIIYSTYVGGLLWEEGIALAVNDEGNVFVTGRTTSYDFPIVNGYDQSFGGGGNYDCFILVLNSTGTGLIYSTYMGGDMHDEGDAISIDDDGNIFIAGTTSERSFPTVNAYDDTWNDGYDCFVLKMNSTGTGLIYSTYVGGTFSETPPYDDRDDIAVAMTVDSEGCAYVTGYTNSQSFPTVNAYDDTLGSWNTDDCFVFKLNATGSGLVYSTYIGDIGQDRGADITIDSAGCAYITGSTQSNAFPLSDAYDTTLNGTSDTFLTKLSSDGNQLLYSTYIGGSETDSGQTLMHDVMNNIYLGGITWSPDFPAVNGADYEGNGSMDCFVLKMNLTANTLTYSTTVGGTLADNLQSLTLDAYGTVYAAGYTYSDDFPLVNPYDATQNGESDVFVFILPDMGDSDADGIPDYNESLYGTDRFSADSDQDGLTDSEELFIHFTNPLSNDSDFDLLDDYAELMIHLTNPLSNDSDSDLMPDGWEVMNLLDPLDPSDAVQDPDNDMLSNLGELQNGTLPNDNDTDSDLMSDGWEVLYDLNPLNPSDASSDLDLDTLTNQQEYNLGTNPQSSDSDVDGIPDAWEVSMGFDPLDSEVSILEFLLYNMHVTFLLSVLVTGTGMAVYYLMRPRLEELKMRKEQEHEQEEIHSVIKLLGGDEVNTQQVDEADNEMYD